MTAGDYDLISKNVHARYYELLNDPSCEDAFKVLKKEFRLSTLQIWEILGIRDELDSMD